MQDIQKPDRVDNRHTAPYVLIAHVAYIEKLTKKVLSKKDIVVARVYTKTEGRRFQDDIGKAETYKYVGIGADSTFVKTFAPAPKYESIIDGVAITEEIYDYTIMEKSKYFNRGN